MYQITSTAISKLNFLIECVDAGKIDKNTLKRSLLSLRKSIHYKKVETYTARISSDYQVRAVYDPHFFYHFAFSDKEVSIVKWFNNLHYSLQCNGFSPAGYKPLRADALYKNRFGYFDTLDEAILGFSSCVRQLVPPSSQLEFSL